MAAICAAFPPIRRPRAHPESLSRRICPPQKDGMAQDLDTMDGGGRSAPRGRTAVGAPARRQLLQQGLGVAVAACFAPLAGCATAGKGGPLLGFKGVGVDASRNGLQLPPGYVASVIAPWGDAIGMPSRLPAWRPDASDSGADQEVQLGMHHGGVQLLALDGDHRGLLVLSHQDTDDGLLHTDGMADWSAAKVRKSQAAHGLSVVEVEQRRDAWQLIRPSTRARRITAYSPVALAGPALGHPLMRTAGDGDGRSVLGTLHNGVVTRTPWGTCLVGEDRWAAYFDGGDARTADQRRWDLPATSTSRWSEHDRRFDARRHPNEFHRFGWIVEIDPLDPLSTPVKRTALGRGAHAGAWVTSTRDGRAVVYSGDGAAFGHLSKFVSRDRVAPGGAKANAALLDQGSLYVARFEADGSGRWIALVHGQGPLTPENGFADAGELMIKTRQAADLLGATALDRPASIALHPQTGEVCCALSGNRWRGIGANPGVDAVNPRVDNAFGQILRWREGGDFDAVAFSWNLLALAGDPENARPDARGNLRGDLFACPDGLAFDARGVLWVQTGVAADRLYEGEMARLGSNQMLACDPRTGEMRRFLTGPAYSRIAGIAGSADGRTLFVNVQHPGAAPGGRNEPSAPDRFSSWPGTQPGARPRSATLVIRRRDGGPIGT